MRLIFTQRIGVYSSPGFAPLKIYRIIYILSHRLLFIITVIIAYNMN